MKGVKHIYWISKIVRFCLALLVLSSCSIRPYQKANEILYLGIKDLTIKDSENKADNEQVLSLVEEQLSYAPNNAIFGSSFYRWHLPLFAPYLYLKYNKSKSFFGKTLHRLGSKPIYIAQVNPLTRCKLTEHLLGENGYFRAKVQHKIIPYKGQKAKLSYLVDLGTAYTFDSIQYLPKQRLGDSLIWEQQKNSQLSKGKRFSLSTLQKEQERISRAFRENGLFYFTPKDIHFEADSLNHSGHISLKTSYSPTVRPKAFRPCYIRNINVRLIEGDEFALSLPSDRKQLDKGIKLFYDQHFPVRNSVMNSCLALRPDSLYRSSQEKQSLQRLNKLGAFTGIEFNYLPVSSERDSLGRELLDLNILLQADKVWDTSLEALFKLKSNDFLGPGLSLGLDRRNAFGGGETLSAHLYGSYEWQTGQAPSSTYTLSINSFQLGLEFALKFPRLLLPKAWFRNYRGDMSTIFKLSGDKVQRSGYYTLNNFGFSTNYLFQKSQKHKHNITPLSVHYNQLSHISPDFAKILLANPSLALSFQSQLIPQISYAYTFQDKIGKNKKHMFFSHSTISEAGNLTNSIYSLIDKDTPSGESKKLFRVPFAQFVKASTELRYAYNIDRKQTLATRLSLGAIYSYGNMLRAPYMEQFYVGGANSIRAYTVRSIGPGRYHKKKENAYSFMDHVGEAKLEANIEYRAKFIGNLELATFLDAGNVWLLRKNERREGASIGEIRDTKDFFNQIAVGTGLGLRYDLSYLVLRFDVGVGLHLPYETERKGWYNIPNFGDAIGLHLSIGYPF